MPKIDQVNPSTAFPSKASVVVIGAGIIGITTALELVERGLDVVVLEKGDVAAEQSSRNWGWCRQMGRDPREIPLIRVSLELWRKMNGRIGAETGFRQCGIAYMSENQAQFQQKIRWVEDNAKPFGLNTRVVTAEELARLVPGAEKSFVGGIYTENDGRAEPFMAVAAMARYFLARGGKIFTGCAARGIETRAGRISAVVTERGVIATDTVVLAGGYWSSRFLGNLGLRFPQLGVVNSVLRTTPLDIGHERIFSGGKFALRKRLDGGFTVAHNHLSVADLTPSHLRFAYDFKALLALDRKGVRLRLGKHFINEAMLARRWALDKASPFERVRVLDPQPINSILAEAFTELQKCFPMFQKTTVVERWAGMIDATPDAVPVIDGLPIAGLFMASGFSGHGFGLGPGAGKLMAEIVTGETPCVDPQAFRFARFSDGTIARPTTGL